jgi:XrtJ-associated TM-motif-TM protein
MTKLHHTIIFVLALFSVTTTLHAQVGCVDSPEAPTIFLLAVGSFSMFCGPYVLRRVLGRREKR